MFILIIFHSRVDDPCNGHKNSFSQAIQPRAKFSTKNRKTTTNRKKNPTSHFVLVALILNLDVLQVRQRRKDWNKQKRQGNRNWNENFNLATFKKSPPYPRQKNSISYKVYPCTDIGKNTHLHTDRAIPKDVRTLPYIHGISTHFWRFWLSLSAVKTWRAWGIESWNITLFSHGVLQRMNRITEVFKRSKSSRGCRRKNVHLTEELRNVNTFEVGI